MTITKKTITLSGDAFRINNAGNLDVLDLDGDDCNWVPSKYEIGAEAVLMSRTNVAPHGRHREQFYLRFDLLGGVPGNSNQNIIRYHGWRGTTNDIEIYAYGLRQIESIKNTANGISITVGPDLLPDEA